MARRKQNMNEDKYVLGQKVEIEKVYASVHECRTLTLVDGKLISKGGSDVFYYVEFNNDLELCVVPRGIGENGKYGFGVSLENPYYHFERPNKTMDYASVAFDFSSGISGYPDYPPVIIPTNITGKLIANIEGILVSAYNANEDLDPVKFLVAMNMVAQCVRTILNGEA